MVAVSQMLSWKIVTVEAIRTVEPGRVSGRVKLGDKDVAIALVVTGAAMHDSRYIQSEEMAKAENVARVAKKGLWAY